MEEGLRYRGLAGVIGEVARLSMTASRRLQLAAEEHGQIAIAIRRWRKVADAADFGQPTAATTRWRVTAQPAAPLPTRGVGQPRWLLELIRARSGDCLDLLVELDPHVPGHLRLPSVVADRSLQARPGQVRAAA
jgi:protein ImuA